MQGGRNSGSSWTRFRGGAQRPGAAAGKLLRRHRRHGRLIALLAGTFALGLVLGSAISLLTAPELGSRQTELLSFAPPQAAETERPASPSKPPHPAPVIAVTTETLPPLTPPLQVSHPLDFIGDERVVTVEDSAVPEQIWPEPPTQELTSPNVPAPVEPPAPARPRLVLNAAEASTPQQGLMHEEAAPAPDTLRLTGEAAWRRNAVEVAAQLSGPAIAIVIDDVGLNRPGARRSIALPPPVTLAMMTYAESLPALAESARSAGHELMVHMPMQPIDGEYDAGVKVLTVGLDRAQLLERLDWGLGRFDGYVGINNHMGSRFTADPSGMETVMAELKRRGLMFLDSKTVGSSLGVEAARRAGVPVVARDIFIDHEQEPGYIRGQLRNLEALARRRGYAIGIGHPHDVTLAELERWMPEARARGISFVPVSAILDLQERSLAARAGENALEVN